MKAILTNKETGDKYNVSSKAVYTSFRGGRHRVDYWTTEEGTRITRVGVEDLNTYDIEYIEKGYSMRVNGVLKISNMPKSFVENRVFDELGYRPKRLEGVHQESDEQAKSKRKYEEYYIASMVFVTREV